MVCRLTVPTVQIVTESVAMPVPVLPVAADGSLLT
jgi:hypothetical protein